VATTRTPGKPSAKARSIDLFTGKTELEEPDQGRPRKAPARKPKWSAVHGSLLSRWETVGGFEVRASKVSNTFTLYVGGDVYDVYPTLAAAVTAAEAIADATPAEHRMDED